MAGTKQGAKKARDTMYELYGKDYYREIGGIGGRLGTTGGFGSKEVGKDGLTGKQRARKAGKAGGSVTRQITIKERTINETNQ